MFRPADEAAKHCFGGRKVWNPPRFSSRSVGRRSRRLQVRAPRGEHYLATAVTATNERGRSAFSRHRQGSRKVPCQLLRRSKLTGYARTQVLESRPRACVPGSRGTKVDCPASTGTDDEHWLAVLLVKPADFDSGCVPEPTGAAVNTVADAVVPTRHAPTPGTTLPDIEEFGGCEEVSCVATVGRRSAGRKMRPMV